MSGEVIPYTRKPGNVAKTDRALRRIRTNCETAQAAAKQVHDPLLDYLIGMVLAHLGETADHTVGGAAKASVKRRPRARSV